MLKAYLSPYSINTLIHFHLNLTAFCHHFEVHDYTFKIVFQASPENTEEIGIFYA